MAIDQIVSDDEELVDPSSEDVGGAVHVSYRAVDNVVDPKRYRLIFRDYKFKRSKVKKTIGAGLMFSFDKDRHPDLENRKMFQDYWLAEGATFGLKNFLVAANINPEMFREEEVIDPETGAIKMAGDGRPLTRCVYSVKDQLDSVAGASVYADIETEEYEGTAADGVTKELRKKSVIAKFVK